jgi:hypothetical protein
VNFRKTPDRAAQPGERRRTFTDEEGVFWEVREIRNPDYDRRAGKSLVFESPHGFRRVRNYPEDWRDRTEAELSAMSKGT